MRSFLLSSRCACTSRFTFTVSTVVFDPLSVPTLYFLYKFAQFHTWIHSEAFLLLQLPVGFDTGKEELVNTAGSFSANPISEERPTNTSKNGGPRAFASAFRIRMSLMNRGAKIENEKLSLRAVAVVVSAVTASASSTPIVLYSGTCVLANIALVPKSTIHTVVLRRWV